MISECECPASTHDHNFSIEPCGKPTTGMSSEFRVVPTHPIVYYIQVKSIPQITITTLA